MPLFFCPYNQLNPLIKKGLYFEKMRELSLSEIYNECQYDTLDEYFFPRITNLFVNKQMIGRIPNWIIFINGHGEYNEKIVAMNLYKFREFLNFLEQNVNVGLLIFISCFSGGTNQNIVFEKDIYLKKHKFPIISYGLSNAPVAIYRNQIKFNKFSKSIQKNISLNTSKDFYEIMKILLKDILPSNYFDIALKNKKWNNLPMIKNVNSEWFQILADPKDVVTIGKILSRSDRDLLKISSYYKTDPKVILLYDDTIPYTLEIKTNRLDAIISMTDNDQKTIIIEKIISNQSINNILNWFMGIFQLEGKVKYIIPKIIAQNKDYHDILIKIQKKRLKENFSQFKDIYLQEAFYKTSKGTTCKLSEGKTNEINDLHKIGHIYSGYLREIESHEKWKKNYFNPFKNPRTKAKIL